MPTFTHGATTIYYEEHGRGYPILLIAPGGFQSMVSSWQRAAINPLESLVDDFRLIAMDQRNAGGSVGPLPLDDPWRELCGDQLALMDHLEIERFHSFGCCIGGPYGLMLSHLAPSRVSASVLEQPMGINEENQAGWLERSHTWARELCTKRDDLSAEDGATFIERMWSRDFAVAVTPDEIREISVPTCVLPGIDAIHPTKIGREIADLLPNATVIEPWKDTPEHTASATIAVRDFLLRHTL